jgi:class 3 adenylate cyclase/tetratricopeptide (TPR) repeat protein
MLDSEQNKLLPQLKLYLPPHLSKDVGPDLGGEELLTILIHITSLRSTLSTYLPSYLVDLIEADPTSGLVGGGFRYGTVMFADVSGFTAMSEKLSTLGKEGAEEITGIVNDYFGTMLEISNNYQGDLLKFGGDALLIFFEGADGPHRALATGQAMQAAMSRFTQVKTSQGVFSLKMSIGVGTGPVFLANLGSDGKMEYTVMGRALSNMAQAEDRATAGQVIVDRTTHDAVADRATFTPASDDFWLLETLAPSDLPLSQATPEMDNPIYGISDDDASMLGRCFAELTILKSLRSFVPDELLGQLIADPQQPTVPGSHRPVTVMFANFYGIDEIIETLGPDYEGAITEILNTHFVAMSRILARYGGVVNKVDTYAIGHRIMALFGALRAHEDDPQRAVRAALEMNEALSEVNRRTREILAAIPDFKVDFSERPLKQRIGLNSGFVFAGNVGSSTRREYSVMGDEVNLTARLMSVAQEGQVLISQSTARHVRDEFTLDEKEPVKVKGKTAPVRNFVVIGERKRPRRWAKVETSPIVGREAELQVGRAAVDQAYAGDGRLLAISGTSGIGKTRLAEEIVYYGQAKGLELLAGVCLSYGQTMTYHPWADILRAYFGLQADAPTQTRIEAIQKGLNDIEEENWAPIIGDVLHLDIPDNDLTRALDAKLRRQRLLDLILKLLQTRSQQCPLMVVVEDVHWADPASMDLINYLSRNIQGYPILMILLHRPEEGVPDWSGYPHTVNIPLSDLPDEALLQIAYNMLGPIALPASLRQMILEKSAGNPFFVEEVVRALIETGALVKDRSGQWRVVYKMETVELPDTIHGLIISRIDRLLEADRRILQVASVVGTTFSSNIVKEIYPYSDLESSIQRRLDHLTGLGLTEREALEVELYRFKHLTTREVVYESQAFEQRRSLHRRIADLIAQTAKTVSEEIDLLAYHYFEGQAWDKALEYNLAAARYAQREFANDIAVTAYRRTLEAAAKLETDTRVEALLAQESLGEIFTVLGQYDEALTHYNSAQAIIETEPDSIDRARHLAELCRKIADVYEKRGEYDTAFEQLERGLRYLAGGEPSIEAARIYLLGSGVYQRQGNYEAAIEWCHESLAVARQIQTREGQQTEGQIYYNLGGIYIRQGDLNRAVDFCLKGIQIYEQIDDIVRLSQAYINLANAYSDQGDWPKASEALHKSLAMKQKIGDILHQGIITNNLANIYLYRGSWDQAADLFEQSRAIWKQVGATAFEAITLSNLAQVHIYRGNWEEARRCLSRSQTILAEVGSEDYLPELERRWGELYLHTQAFDRALEHIHHSIELAVKLKARLEEGMSYRVLGQFYLLRNEWGVAEAALDKSLAILNDLNSEYEAAKTMLAKVCLAMARRPAKATQPQLQPRQDLRQAIEIFEKLGAQADLAEALAVQERLSQLTQ